MSVYDKIIRIKSRQLESIKDTASFDKPQICGCFSIDKERKYIPGPENILYYYPRFDEINAGRFQLNLNSGIERAVLKPKFYEKLDHILRFLEQQKNSFVGPENKLIDAEFICFRGLLTKIMCSIFIQDEWIICASKWKGNIYLCECEPEVKANYNISEAEMNKFCSWGYKFEQYMLTDKLGVEPDTSKPVFEAEEFCCMYKSKLGSHSLIYGAEMDGAHVQNEINLTNPDWDNIEFIELKTNKDIQRQNDETTLKKFKYIKWWCQSFLVNIKQIHCGFRDKNGIVRDILRYNVRDLPRMSNNMWDWRICLNFCNIFLNIVKEIIPEDTDDPYTVWKFEWKPQCREIKYEELKGHTRDSFLPKWYIDSMLKK